MTTFIQQVFDRVSALGLTMSAMLKLRGFRPGGAAGQVMAKASTENFDLQWIDLPELEPLPEWLAAFDSISITPDDELELVKDGIAYWIPLNRRP